MESIEEGDCSMPVTQSPTYLSSLLPPYCTHLLSMDLQQLESSFALLLPDLIALLSALSDSNDSGDVLLVKQVRFSALYCLSVPTQVLTLS